MSDSKEHTDDIQQRNLIKRKALDDEEIISEEEDEQEKEDDEELFVKESDRGYIYIEAFKSNHVKAACEDIRSLNISNLQIVPIKEMTDILLIVRTTYEIKKGSWVRVKRGIYRDDLAKVEHCDMGKNMVTIKLIPRIDYTKKCGSSKSNSAKLFDEKAVEIFEGEKYDNKGFLIKNFPLHAVSTDGITPNINELDKFEETIDGPKIIKTKTSKNDLLLFSPGDHIEVCKGELINLQGTIVGIDGDLIRILSKHEALKDEIPFKANELRKYFSVENHVKVLNGRFEGETEMIVGIDETKAIVLNDGTKDEMLLRTSDLQICKEIAVCIDSTGQFQFRDLINISADKVGVVIRTEKERLHVLNMDGKVQIVSIQSVTKRKRN
ncbi:unnamed protein product [Rotaria sp. Silwood2]|nr:unnamed protein product [Rotaria sp. Silwood2]